MRAGHMAMERFANVEAVDHLNKALALNAEGCDPPARAAAEL
jgi:hypothetical protein